MSEDEFTRLFRHMNERFDKLDASIGTKASSDDMQRALGLLDAIAKQQEISEDERLIVGHQLERLDHWVHGLADKIGYELSA